MDKGKAIELLKEALAELGQLRSLSLGNQKFDLWYNKVLDIIELASGKDSSEYDRFVRAVSVYYRADTEAEQWKEYNRRLDKYETVLLSILRKYELLGVENETVTKPEITESPITIYDAMNFHPKVVEASRKLFQDGHYRDAIYRAFVEVNNFVKDKANSQLDGKKLMSTVFNLDNPIIKLNSLKTKSDRDEQEGFMFLFMGAMEGIRNPKAHENIIQNDPYKALEYLSFASLLIETIDFWEAEKT